MTISEARVLLSSLLGSYHHAAQYGDAVTVTAMARNAKDAIDAWEEHNAQHGTPTQWAKTAEDAIERLAGRLANPPKKEEPREHDPRSFAPSKWARIGDMMKQNEREREYLAKLAAEAKKGSAA